MKTLDLVLKGKWYDMIDSGEKKEEYREIKAYWCNRILYHTTLGVKEYWEDVLAKARELIAENPKCFNLPNLLIRNYGTRGYTHVRFRRGYTCQDMLFEIDSIEINTGNSEWGAEDGVEYFVIKLGKRL